MKRLSFITQFKVEFLLPFTGCRKVLGKMSVHIKTMETYCVSCNKNLGNKHSSGKRTKLNTCMLVSNCVVSCKKKIEV